MLFNVRTGRLSSLARGQELSYNEWSQNGKYVYLRENQDGAGQIVCIRVKDLLKETVVSLKEFPQLTDMFATWLGLSPNDDPLLLRDRSLQEIYALDLVFH